MIINCDGLTLKLKLKLKKTKNQKKKRSASIAPVADGAAYERAGAGVAGVAQRQPQQPVQPSTATSTTARAERSAAAAPAAHHRWREQLGDGPRTREQQRTPPRSRRLPHSRITIQLITPAGTRPTQWPRIATFGGDAGRRRELDRPRHGHLHGPQHHAPRSGPSLRRHLFFSS